MTYERNRSATRAAIVRKGETQKEDEEVDRGRRRASGTSTTRGGRREDSVPDERQAQTALHSIPTAGGRH